MDLIRLVLYHSRIANAHIHDFRITVARRFFIGRGSAMLHRLPNILSPLRGSSAPLPKSRSDVGY